LGGSAVLAVVCAASRRLPLQFGRVAVDVADVAMLAALVMLGPVWALLVATPATLYKERLRTVFVAAGDTVRILAAGCLFQLLATPLLFAFRLDSAFVYGLLAAASAFYALDALINSALLRLKYGTPLLQTLKESFLPLVPSDVIAVLAALGTSWAMVAFGPAAALILFSGAAAALISLHLIHGRQRENEALRAENARLLSGLLSSHLALAERIVGSLGRKDGYTARHAAASALYAADLAGELGLEPAQAEKLKVAALLQDVGLVSVPDEVLLTRPGKLNSVGRGHLEEHPIHSQAILSSVPEFEEAARWVRWHHEREDGTGYPDRLRGEWIPPEAKILAVSGHYASLILDGPHSPGIAPQEARRELTRLAGSGLDAKLVRAFLRLLDSEDENYARAADDRFAFPVAALGPERSPSGGGTGPLRPTGTAVEADPR